jgi:hypothetical protein
VILLASGCAPRIDFGSEILWSARHETGNFDEWTLASLGGPADDPPTATAAVTTEQAHTGSYAVKLTNSSTGAFDTARVWREQDFPAEAYYSAWFYLPQANQTTADWTILQFRERQPLDPSMIAQGLDIDLRSLPGGDLILSVFDHRAAYLRSPTPDVAMPVPIGRWFQIEVFFRNAADDSGRFTVWLDGQLYYDLQRPTKTSDLVYWSPCNITEDLVPPQSAIYVDDAAVSLVRLTPSGTLD